MELKTFKSLRSYLRWTRSQREAERIMAHIAELYPFTKWMFNSTVPGKLKIVVPDQALAVGASATVNGTGANKGTATDLVLVLSNTGGSGTVTPSLNGSNVLGSGYVAVTPDKGTLVNLVGATSVQVVHAAQLQFQFYRVTYVSGATSGTTATDVFIYVPVEDSFDATVQ